MTDRAPDSMYVTMASSTTRLSCGHCGQAMVIEYEQNVPHTCFCSNAECVMRRAKYEYPSFKVKRVGESEEERERRLASEAGYAGMRETSEMRGKIVAEQSVRIKELEQKLRESEAARAVVLSTAKEAWRCGACGCPVEVSRCKPTSGDVLGENVKSICTNSTCRTVEMFAPLRDTSPLPAKPRKSTETPSKAPLTMICPDAEDCAHLPCPHAHEHAPNPQCFMVQNCPTCLPYTDGAACPIQAECAKFTQGECSGEINQNCAHLKSAIVKQAEEEEA